MAKKTFENLVNAFIGESQARNKYSYYSKIAKKEGFVEIFNKFLEISEQESVHAKRIYEFIQDFRKDEDIKVDLKVDTSSLVYGSTSENLKAAIAGESHEYQEMYPEFAEIAESEGYSKIADRLRAIAKAEENHKEIFSNFLENIENNSVFKKNEEIYWVCQECGYIHYGNEAPELCPSCNHPQAYFKVR
ncbi:rubrerythrin family protein [Patescibacteria group bacterium]|nr:rubrerythrin family protein [Patescibacteria group bacterium]